MLHLTVECLQFGDLALVGAPHGSFDVLRLGAENSATAIARIEVEHAHMPTLRVTRIDPRERFIDRRGAATMDRAVLATWRDESPSHFELSAARQGDALEIVLHGDCRHRLFRWRAEFAIEGGDAVFNGPFLANDPDT